jgi:hypothetical protein
MASALFEEEKWNWPNSRGDSPVGQTPLQSFLGLQQDGVHGSDTRQPVTDQVQDNTDATDLPDQVQNLLLLHQHFASAAGQVSANKFWLLERKLKKKRFTTS